MASWQQHQIPGKTGPWPSLTKLRCGSPVSDSSGESQKWQGEGASGAPQSRGAGWQAGWSGGVGPHRLSLGGRQEKEEGPALKRDVRPAHHFSSWARWSAAPLAVLPITLPSSRLQLLPALHRKSLSVSTSLTCHFIKIKYVQAFFPFHFGAVSEKDQTPLFSRVLKHNEARPGNQKGWRVFWPYCYPTSHPNLCVTTEVVYMASVLQD